MRLSGFKIGLIQGVICLVSWGGSVEVITHGVGAGKGYVPLSAIVENTVSLRLEDSPAGGGNLAGATGIAFGQVNSHGTTKEPGVRGFAKGQVGHYEADFALTAQRTGTGNVTLHVARSLAGNFAAKDGVEMEDAYGVLRPLSALTSLPIHVLLNQPPGTYEKTIAINIYPADAGTLRTVLQFTLCAL